MAKKTLNFKDNRQKISVPLAMSTNLQKTSSKLFKKQTNKKILGRSWAKIGLRKTQATCLVRSGEIPSPRQTSIDKTSDCVINSERGALVRGSDPPSGHSVHNTAGNTWRAPARRLLQKIYVHGCVENSRPKISIPPRWQKIELVSGWEKTAGRRGQPLAS